MYKLPPSSKVTMHHFADCALALIYQEKRAIFEKEDGGILWGRKQLFFVSIYDRLCLETRIFSCSVPYL